MEPDASATQELLEERAKTRALKNALNRQKRINLGLRKKSIHHANKAVWAFHERPDEGNGKEQYEANAVGKRNS